MSKSALRKPSANVFFLLAFLVLIVYVVFNIVALDKDVKNRKAPTPAPSSTSAPAVTPAASPTAAA